MQKLNYSIKINASKEKVWNTMLNKETYEQWTSVFNPTGSYYEGGWSTGDEIKFLGPDENGTVSGMLSRIKESRPFDFVSIQHLGEIHKGEVTTWKNEKGEDVEAYENYTFNEKGGETEVIVDITTTATFPEGMSEMFGEMWPKGLEKLKEIAEK